MQERAGEMPSETPGDAPAAGRKRARLVRLPVPARPSKRLEALLFSPTLDALLVASDLRSALEAARAENARLEAELRALVQRTSHLLFVATARGYELREATGPAPGVGDAVGDHVVVKVGPSPLPRDRRRCAYLSRS